MKGLKLKSKFFTKKNSIVFTIVFISIAVGFLAGRSIGQNNEIGFLLQENQIKDLSTNGFVAMKPEVGVVENDGAISLIGNCYRVSARTEIYQAESIANGLAGKIIERPNAHDLLKDELDSFGIDVMMVKIVNIKNNFFIGKIILKQDDRIASLESKPSDGIALAVRTNATIYMNETLMKTYGEKIC